MPGAVKRSASIHPVELKISNLHQLFNSMDPSPFHERDLDDDAEEFITSWAREAPKDAGLRLIIHLAQPVPGLPDPQSTVAGSIHHYFIYRSEILWREFKQLLKEGRASLLIGLLFLATCNAIASLLAHDAGTLHGVASEGLAVLGWVAMWHPLDILLYRWWPVLQKKRLYDKLAGAEVEVRVVDGITNLQ